MKKGDKEKVLIHEFDVPERGIPKRSFLRSNASEQSGNLTQLSKQLLNESLAGNISHYDAYATIGSYFQGKIVDKITKGDFEHNTTETTRRKLATVRNNIRRSPDANKPLINTRQLHASITYEVRKK